MDKNNITINCSVYEANRTNTAMYIEKGVDGKSKFNAKKYMERNGYTTERILEDFEFCLKNNKDDMAIECVERLVNGILSAYDLMKTWDISLNKTDR